MFEPIVVKQQKELESGKVIWVWHISLLLQLAGFKSKNRDILQKLKEDQHKSGLNQFFIENVKAVLVFWNVFVLSLDDILPWEGFIFTFTLSIILSFTFHSSKLNYSSSSKCCLTRTNNSIESVQLSFHYLKRDASCFQ